MVKELVYRVKRKVQRQFKIQIPKDIVDSNQIKVGQTIFIENCESHLKIWFVEKESQI